MVKHKAKYYLANYQCGNCESGVVQIHQVWKRGNMITTTVSGCLDCGHDYGIRQAQYLKKYESDYTVWP